MKNILYFFLKVTKSFSLITNLNLSDKIQSVAMFAEAGSSVAKHRSFTVIGFFFLSGINTQKLVDYILFALMTFYSKERTPGV